jgi:hypothetical protein
MFNKILYIGAGDDLKPLSIFPYSKFVYIDSLPRNAYGYPYYYRGFYNGNFKQKVIDKLSNLSFYEKNEQKFSDFYSEINVTNLDSHLVTFKRDEGDPKIFKYYFSTGIPENLYDGDGYLNEELKKDISECDTILVKGHWPHKDTFLYTNKPIHFIGSYLTYFPENKIELELDFDRNNIIYFFLNHPEYISSYSYLNKLGEISTFQTYDEFYKFYNENKGYNEGE